MELKGYKASLKTIQDKITQSDILNQDRQLAVLESNWQNLSILELQRENGTLKSDLKAGTWISFFASLKNLKKHEFHFWKYRYCIRTFPFLEPINISIFIHLIKKADAVCIVFLALNHTFNETRTNIFIFISSSFHFFRFELFVKLD